jgi:hypothetical protein
MANRFISDLIGTARDYFRIGFTGVRLKNVAGALSLRNAADTLDASAVMSDIQLTGGTPLAGKVWAATDGVGNGDWATLALTSNAERVNSEAFTQVTSTPLTIYTPVGAEIVTMVVVEIPSAASGGAPTLAIGIAGQTGLYMATTEINLKEVGIYVVEPMISNAGGTAIIATLVPNAQTFSGTITVFTSAPA